LGANVRGKDRFVKKMGKKILLFIAFICLSNILFAETILLKSGRTIEAKIIKKDSSSIKVDVAGLPITYYLTDIESINGEKINVSSPKESSSASIDSKKEPHNQGVSVMHTTQVSGEESEYTILVNRAVDLMDKKDFTSAIAELKKAIEKAPDRSAAYLNIATCYHFMNQDQEALEYLKKAYSINPNDSGIVGNLGVIYFTLGKYEQGVDYLQKAILMQPNNGRYHYSLGVAYYQLKKYKEAKESFIKAKELCKNANDAQGVSTSEYYLNELQNIK